MVADDRIAFFQADNTLLFVGTTLFIHSCVGGHLGFYILAVVNDAAMTMVTVKF